MKKTVNALLCLALAACLLLCLAACGKNAAPTGTYVLTRITYGETDLSGDALADMLLTPVEEHYYLLLQEDGTGVLCIAAVATDILYKDGVLWTAEDPDETTSFTVSGDKIILSDDGETIEFTKK